MQLTVLGASPVRPNPGGACAGYLVQHEGASVLVDCGSGVVSRLQRILDPADLAAVFISHAHPDHFLDLVGLRYGFLYGVAPAFDVHIPLYVSAPAWAVIDAVGRAFAPEGGFWDVFDVHPVAPGDEVRTAGARVTFAPTKHYVECLAFRFTAGGRSIAYTADSGPDDDLAAFARGADMLVAECTLPERAGSEDEWGHMAPDEAGAMAADAGADRLLLTHYWGELDADDLRRRAAARFDGPVEMAMEMATYGLD